MSRLGGVPPFGSELNFKFSGLEVDVLPSLDESRVGLIEVEIDLGSGKRACGIPSKFDGFCRVDGRSSSRRRVQVASF